MRHILKDLLPPILTRGITHLIGSTGTSLSEWALLPNGWPEGFTNIDSDHWNSAKVRDTQGARWGEFCQNLESTSPLGIPYEYKATINDSLPSHNNFQTFASVVARCAASRSHISVLDWGGSLGHYQKVAKALLPYINLDYTVVEVPLLAEAGKALNPQVTFISQIESGAAKFNLVVASSSVHYEEDWKSRISNLQTLSTEMLYVARVPIFMKRDTAVLQQQVSSYGFAESLVSWCFNHGEFIQATATGGFRLLREFVTDQPLQIPGVKEPVISRGFLFSRV